MFLSFFLNLTLVIIDIYLACDLSYVGKYGPWYRMRKLTIGWQRGEGGKNAKKKLTSLKNGPLLNP